MMKKLTYLTLCALFLFSCQKDSNEIPNNSGLNNEQSERISKSEIDKIKALNLNPENVELVDYPNLDGEMEKAFLIEGDIIMTKDRLNQLSTKELDSKQYRTYNLVDNNKTIYLWPRSFPDFLSDREALTSKQRSALTKAIANFNALDIGLRFEITDTGIIGGDVIGVSQRPGAAGGVAGFPEDGYPFSNIDIFSGLESYSLAVNEHVITHEIGHAIGLRHTDFETRWSCGSGSQGESQNPEGAVYIVGTPPNGSDPTSLMLACFDSNESGNFGPYDIIALENLYPN